MSGGNQPIGRSIGGPAPTGTDAFATSLGIHVPEAGVARVTIEPHHLNPVGILLGPVGFSLVDYAMGSLAWSTIDAEREFAVTVNIALNWIEGARSSGVVARARMDRRTRSLAQLGAEVRDDDGRLLITAIGGFAIRPIRDGQPSRTSG